MSPEGPREDAFVLPDEPWATRYEELRQLVTARACAIERTYAYALLVRRGLVAWMKAWPRPAPETARDRGFGLAVDGVTVPSHLVRSAASLLVNMILIPRHQAEVHHEQRIVEGLAQTP
jgi:hypothetical protein